MSSVVCGVNTVGSPCQATRDCVLHCPSSWAVRFSCLSSSYSVIPTIYWRHPLIHAFISRKTFGAAGCALAVALLAGCATQPAGPSVSLLEPANGATVGTTFKVVFGVNGMKVAPAGDIVANSGHNHLLINKTPVAAGQSVPFDDQHRHFGTGQTEAMITLPPGATH